MDFRSYLQNIKKLKFKSIDTKLSSLTSFNEFLVQIGVQKDLVITAEDRLKFQQEIASPAEIEKKDVEAFLQKVLVDTGKRNYAIAVILAYAGLRVSECISIGLTDIDFQARELLVTGKGNKQRIVFINDKIIHAVREYLKVRNSQSEYLFVSRNGGKLHRSSVSRFFQSVFGPDYTALAPALLLLSCPGDGIYNCGSRKSGRTCQRADHADLYQYEPGTDEGEIEPVVSNYKNIIVLV